MSNEQRRLFQETNTLDERLGRIVLQEMVRQTIEDSYKKALLLLSLGEETEEGRRSETIIFGDFNTPSEGFVSCQIMESEGSILLVSYLHGAIRDGVKTRISQIIENPEFANATAWTNPEELKSKNYLLSAMVRKRTGASVGSVQVLQPATSRR